MTARLWNLALYGVIFLTISAAAERVLSTAGTPDEVHLRQSTLWGLMLVVLAVSAPGIALARATRGRTEGGAGGGLVRGALGILWRTGPYLLAIPFASLRVASGPRPLDVLLLFGGFALATEACGKLVGDRAGNGGSRRALAGVALYAATVVLVFRAAHPEETFWPLVYTRGSMLTPPKAGGSLHTAAPSLPAPRHPLPVATPARVRQVAPALVMLSLVLALLAAVNHRAASAVKAPEPIEAGGEARPAVDWIDWLLFWATVLLVLLNASGVDPSPGPGHSTWILFETTCLILAAVLASRALPAGRIGWFGLVAAAWGGCLQLFRSGTGTEGMVLAPLVASSILGVSLVDRGIVATLAVRFSPGLHDSLQRMGTTFVLGFFLLLDATLFRFLYQSEPQVMFVCWIVLKALALAGMTLTAWLFSTRMMEESP